MRFYPSSGHRLHKVFISYHHYNDQWYKNKLVEVGKEYGIFIDRSVDTGDIPDHWPDETIRETIRDGYLRDSTVTILLVGTDTRNRKHVDWELYSSMFDGPINKKSGILIVNLPTTDTGSYWAAHGSEEKSFVYPHQSNWERWVHKADFEVQFPYMPSRILENLTSGAKISVVGWHTFVDSRVMKFLIDTTFASRASCTYNLSTRMRRRNS